MGDPLQVVADPLKAVPEVFRRVVVEQCDLRSVAANLATELQSTGIFRKSL